MPAVTVQAGRYDKLLVIEENRGGGKNELGESLDDWREVFTRFGSVMPLKSWQIFQARQAQSYATHVIELRWEPQLELSPLRHRLRLGERIFYPEGPPRNVEEADVKWELTVIERTMPTGQ